jgi:ketosteroid isomerase-like protein
MAELTGVAKRTSGGEMRMSMAEVFVMRNGKIAERRAWVTAFRKMTTAEDFYHRPELSPRATTSSSS